MINSSVEVLLRMELLRASHLRAVYLLTLCLAEESHWYTSISAMGYVT